MRHLLRDGLTNEPPVGGSFLLAEDQARGRGYVLDRPWFLFVEHGEVDRHE